MKEFIELSIIILCYRSGETIIELCNEVELIAKGLTDNYEIVLVGNYIEGSDDCTKDVVQQIAANSDCINAVCLPKKGMMGWDMRTGIEIANGIYLCVVDGDGQYPLDSITRCYREIKTGKYDLVKTYRIKRFDGLYRRILSILYNLTFACLFPNFKSKDINSKPKIFTRNAYECMDLTSDDWFIDAEIMLNVRRLKMRYHEFPIEFYLLSDRKSFLTPMAIIEFLKNLIIYRINEFRYFLSRR